jgi:hypothetical protein
VSGRDLPNMRIPKASALAITTRIGGMTKGRMQ